MSAPHSKEVALTRSGHELDQNDSYDIVKDRFEHGLSLFYDGANPEVLTSNARIQSAVLPVIDYYKGTRNEHVDFCMRAAVQAAKSSPRFRSVAPEDLIPTVQADMARTDRRMRVSEVVKQITVTIVKNNQDATPVQKRALSEIAHPKFIASDWERTALLDEVTSKLESQACTLAIKDIKQQPTRITAIPRLLDLSEKHLSTSSDNQVRRQNNHLLRLYAESANPRTVIVDHHLDIDNIRQIGRHLHQPPRDADIANRNRFLDTLQQIPPRTEDAMRITEILQDIVSERVVEQYPQRSAAQTRPEAVAKKAIQKVSEITADATVRPGSVTDTRAMTPSMAIQVPLKGRGKGNLLVSGSSAAALLGIMGGLVSPAAANAAPANQNYDLQLPTTTNLHLSGVALPSRITRPASVVSAPVTKDIVQPQTDIIDLSISPADQTSTEPVTHTQIEPVQPSTGKQVGLTSEITTVTPPITAVHSVSQVTPQITQAPRTPEPSQVTQLGIPSQSNQTGTEASYQPVSLQIGGYTAPSPNTPITPVSTPIVNASRAHAQELGSEIRSEAVVTPVTPLAVQQLDITVNPDAPRADYAPVVGPTLTVSEAAEALDTAVNSNQSVDVLVADYDNLLLAQGKITTLEPADLPLTQAAVKAAIVDSITRLQSQRSQLPVEQFNTGMKAALLADAIARHPGIADGAGDLSHLIDTQHPNFTQTIVSGMNANPDTTTTPFTLEGTEVGSNSNYAYTESMLNQLTATALSSSMTDAQRTALQLNLNPSSEPDVTTVPQTLSDTGAQTPTQTTPAKPSPNVKTNNPPAQPKAPATPKHTTAPTHPKVPETHAPAEHTSLLQQNISAAEALIAQGGETGRKGLVLKVCFENGFTAIEASGIVGNLTQESNDNPNSTSSGGGTIGIGQWEGGRDDNLRRFAAARNKPWNDLETQVLFLISEMHKQYPGGHLNELRQIMPNATAHTSAYEALKAFTTDTPAKAAMVFEYTFERAGDPRMSNRVRYAQDIYDKHAGHLNKVVSKHESNESSSQKLAQDILKYWGKSIDGNPQPLHDLQTVAAGKMIDNWADTHNVPTTLDPRMLEVYDQFAKEGKWKVHIWNMVSGHGWDPMQHPHGKASDIGSITDLQTGQTSNFYPDSDGFNSKLVQEFRYDLSVKLPEGSWLGQEALGGHLAKHMHTGYDKPTHQHFQLPYDN